MFLLCLAEVRKTELVQAGKVVYEINVPGAFFSFSRLGFIHFVHTASPFSPARGVISSPPGSRCSSTQCGPERRVGDDYVSFCILRLEGSGKRRIRIATDLLVLVLC